MHDTSSILHGMRTHTRAHTHTTTILHRPTGYQQAYGLPTGLRAPNGPTGTQQAYGLPTGLRAPNRPTGSRGKSGIAYGFCSFVGWRFGPTGYNGKSGIALRASALLSASALGLRATMEKAVSPYGLLLFCLLAPWAYGLRKEKAVSPCGLLLFCLLAPWAYGLRVWAVWSLSQTTHPTRPSNVEAPWGIRANIRGPCGHYLRPHTPRMTL